MRLPTKQLCRYNLGRIEKELQQMSLLLLIHRQNYK